MQRTLLAPTASQTPFRLAAGKMAQMCAALGLLSLLAAGPTGCGTPEPDHLALSVTLTGVSAATTKLTVTATLNGKPAMQPFDVPVAKSRFGVTLPKETEGSLVLTVQAYDVETCRIAQGTASATLPGMLQFTLTAPVDALPNKECPPPIAAVGCDPAAFCFSNPLPTGNAYLALWSNSATDTWAVGDGGLISHYDGKAWTTIPSGVSDSLTGIWGNSASDMWAVGEKGRILRLDGRTFKSVPSNTANNLLAIWGNKTEIWAAGQLGTVLRYTAATGTWTPVDVGTTNNLTSIWGPSASQLYMVGSGGTIMTYSFPSVFSDGKRAKIQLTDQLRNSARAAWPRTSGLDATT